jgi:NAD-dependent deacetylase sirtuin 4
VKTAVENAIDEASRVLVLGSSLATYSAWRLIKRAKEQGMPIGIANMGGVRGEEQFFTDLSNATDGRDGVRCAETLETFLPNLVERIRESGSATSPAILEGVLRNPNFRPAPWA